MSEFDPGPLMVMFLSITSSAARQTNRASYRKADGVPVIRDRQCLTQRSGTAIICVGDNDVVRFRGNGNCANQRETNSSAETEESRLSSVLLVFHMLRTGE